MLGVSLKMNSTIKSKPLHGYRAYSSSSPAQSEHYIHSRLKSSLQSGPKENLYSGILEGGKVRRKASLDSEVKTRMLCNEAPIQSATTLQSPKHHLLLPDSFVAESVSTEPFLSSQEKEMISQRVCMNGTASIDTMQQGVTSCPPQLLHYSPSSVTEERPGQESSSIKLRLSPTSIPMKDATVNVIDFKKKRKACDKESIAPQRAMPQGFMKRAALIKACARVAALAEGTRYSSMNTLPPRASQLKRVGLSQKSLPLLEMSATGITDQQTKDPNTRKRSSATTNSNQNNSKKRKGYSTAANEGSFTPNLLYSPSRVKNLADSRGTYSRPEICQSNSERDRPESVASSESESSVSSTSQAKKEVVIQFNSLGLLCTGDCIYPSKRILLTTEGYIPARIMPIVIPEKLSKLPPSDPLRKSVKLKPIKGDNSWVPTEQPIKTVYIRQPNAKKVARHYFACIKRKNDVINVRDCILIRSGKKNPYVAKIAGIWQESDGIMLTVFWYYRAEDTTFSVSQSFQEMELMASQHHDDVSVACIDDSCIVLGLSQYCRYQATQKRVACGIPRSTAVPRLKLEECDDRLHSHHSRDTANQLEKPLLHKRIDEDKLFPTEKSVYFCYRAYNHITRRIIK